MILNLLLQRWLLLDSDKKNIVLLLPSLRHDYDKKSEVAGKHGYGPRPQVSRQMPRVGLKWVGRCCLPIVTLRHAYLMPRLSVYHLLRDSCRKLTMNRNFFLPKKYKNLNSTSTTKTKTNKYTRRLRYTWKTLLKLKNTEKLKYVVSKNTRTTNKDKNNQIHSHIKIHLNDINKVGKYIKLIVTLPIHISCWRPDTL